MPIFVFARLQWLQRYCLHEEAVLLVFRDFNRKEAMRIAPCVIALLLEM